MPYLGSPLAMSAMRAAEPALFGQGVQQRQGMMPSSMQPDFSLQPNRLAELMAAQQMGLNPALIAANAPTPPLERSPSRDALRAALLEQQGWDAQRAQQGQFQQQALQESRKSRVANTLADDLTNARNIYSTLLATPGLPPAMVTEAQQAVDAASKRLYRHLGIDDEADAAPSDAGPVRPPRSLQEITAEVDERARQGGSRERRRPSPRLQQILADPAAVQMLLEMRNQ